MHSAHLHNIDIDAIAGFPLIEMGTGGRSKGYRFEEIMAPYFEMGRVWIVHPYTPFIRKFMDEWVGWSGDDKNDECDCLDAVFYALAASGLFLEEAWAAADTIRDKPWYEKEEAPASPFGSFGRQARGHS